MLIGPTPAFPVWRDWVMANIGGEMVGFGLGAALGSLLGAAIEGATGFTAPLLMVTGVFLVGGTEGIVVGAAQWLVLRRVFPTISLKVWTLATAIGAILAWGAGMAIGTMMSEAPERPEVAGPWIGAMIIGALAGAILSAAQALVLSRVIRRAKRWIGAHMLAWSFGMAIAFGGFGLLPGDAPIPLVVITGAVTGLAMGGVAAAITGLALLSLLGSSGSAGGDSTHLAKG